MALGKIVLWCEAIFFIPNLVNKYRAILSIYKMDNETWPYFMLCQLARPDGSSNGKYSLVVFIDLPSQF